MFFWKKSMINCPNCYKKIPENSKFCSHCGAVVGAPKPKTEPKMKCPICSKTIQENSRFCGNCGAPIGLAPVNVVKPNTGLSYGPVMPAEENQYSYPGEWKDYFRMLFKENFPEYRVAETVNPMINRRELKSYGYTFLSGGRAVLIVDVRTERCSSKALRESCKQLGVPYLRFYFDHHGWWNTRSYVIGRVKAALGKV